MLQHYYEAVCHRTPASLLSTSACQGLVFSLNIWCLFLTFLRRACDKVTPPIHRTPDRQQYRVLLSLSQEKIKPLVLMWPAYFANDASSDGLLSFVSLPLTLPSSQKAFSCRSLPTCFHESSTKWFAINACTSNAVGLLPSLRKLLTDSTERATSKCHFIIVTHLSAQR